jgi:protein-S-isoprenylcysteine O-methyltransferase Ste14
VLAFAGSEAMRYAGLALYTVGNLLALVSLRALGKQYSGYVTLQENHQLVQTGIYGLIRHPIYLRALLVAVGLPLIFRSQLVFPFLVFIAVFVAVRIRQEEKLLAEQFGAEFEAYRRRTWRLLPYLF